MSKSESKAKISFFRNESNNRIYLAFNEEGEKKWELNITDQVMGLVIGKLFADAPNQDNDSIVIKKTGKNEFKQMRLK